VDEHGDEAQGAAQRVRAGVAHEHLAGLALNPEGTPGRAVSGRRRHGEFSRAGDVGDLQVGLRF